MDHKYENWSRIWNFQEECRRIENKKTWYSLILLRNFLATTNIYITKIHWTIQSWIGCLINLKFHFLDSHLENLGTYSVGHGERFHKDLKEIETRYKGFWGISEKEYFRQTQKGAEKNFQWKMQIPNWTRKEIKRYIKWDAGDSKKQPVESRTCNIRVVVHK